MSIVYTICMQTTDAISRGEGEFTMELAGDQPRISAVKLNLGSLEFPMTQWSIEEEWARIYFSEALRINPGLSVFRVDTIVGDTTRVHLVQMPLHLNAIEEYRRLDDGVVISCYHPHGLLVVDGSRRVCTIDWIVWGEVEVVCAPIGRLSISQVHREGKLRYLSPTEFIVPSSFFEGASSTSHRGYMHAPGFPSPVSLCRYLSSYLHALQAPLSVEYDARTNKVHVVSTTAEKTPHVVRVHGGDLAATLGYPSPRHERHFRPEVDADRRVPSEVYAHWTFGELRPGWYVPSQRPMCTGQPMRFPQEAEMACNPLYFPLSQIPTGAATPHFLVFVDPCSHMHHCPIYVGKHAPHALCTHLENAMTAIATPTCNGVAFSVTYEDERFSIACEVQSEDGRVQPTPFQIHFHHPQSIDAARLGFDDIPLCGSDVYTSTRTVVFPRQQGRMLNNLVRVSEIGHEKRFRIHAAAVPPLTGLIAAYNEDESTLVVRTYAGQVPFSHGL